MTFRFGHCILDTQSRRLVRGGRDVHLSPKGFEILKVLVESRPRVLSKCELLERVWSGIAVSDASLAKVISKVRQATGDSDDAMPIIRTVHGFGYVFAAHIEDDRAVDRPRHAQATCWLFCGSREFPLPDGEHTVGREPDASICLHSPRVSRRHARLVVNGGSATLEDLGSKNGSFVRGARILAPTKLQAGDVTRIGPFSLVFWVGAGFESTQSDGS